MKKKVFSRPLPEQSPLTGQSLFNPYLPIVLALFIVLTLGFANPVFTLGGVEAAHAEAGPYYEYVVTRSISTKPIYQKVAMREPADRAARRQMRVHYLLENLRHKREVVRIHASSELAKYREYSDYIVPMLVSSLKDSSKYVRRNSAKSLGAYGSLASNAIPALERALKDRDKYVAHSVANSLRKIGTVRASQALQGFTDRVR